MIGTLRRAGGRDNSLPVSGRRRRPATGRPAGATGPDGGLGADDWAMKAPREHHRAAHELRRGEVLAEQHPGEHGRDDRLQAGDDARHLRRERRTETTPVT